MTQLAFIKYLDCVERVRTPESINPFVGKIAMSDEIGVAAASTNANARNMCDAPTPPPTNTSMESAQEIEVESLTSGNIAYARMAQWFKITIPQSKYYSIYTTGSLDTVGTLYDDCGNQIVRVDDRTECGKANFRIYHKLDRNTTYYIRVTEAKSNTGSYTLVVTERVLADSVTITPSSIILEQGKTYELPTTPNTFVDVAGVDPLRNVYVNISPASANEQKVLWHSFDHDVIDTYSGFHGDQRYHTISPVGSGTATLYAYDWWENGNAGECTVYVPEVNANAPKVTVVSCIADGWIVSSDTMGADMANAFGCTGSYTVETPTTISSFETCWRETNECMIVHTHGGPNSLVGQINSGAQSQIISKYDIENLPINTKIRFIMMTACEVAGGLAYNNIAYWLSKRIHPNGIVIANTDEVTGGDKTFRGSDNEKTWKVYKNGEIWDIELPLTLTMADAYSIYEECQ
ncbi:MAG: hypothetical protein E7589_04085 [Ruminococcaceae bacterium]|nr:hypothetical protein [Oscillospiraceae bacterium]